MFKAAAGSISSAGPAASSSMPLRETVDLIAGNATVIEVVTAMLCQPRFRAAGGLNGAGEELRDLVTGLELRNEALLDLIELMPAASEFEHTNRLATLLRFRSAEAMSSRELSALTAGLTGSIN